MESWSESVLGAALAFSCFLSPESLWYKYPAQPVFLGFLGRAKVLGFSEHHWEMACRCLECGLLCRSPLDFPLVFALYSH